MDALYERPGKLIRGRPDAVFRRFGGKVRFPQVGKAEAIAFGTAFNAVAVDKRNLSHLGGA